MTHTLADGCCSAATPCSHQKRDPRTICPKCRAASLSVSQYLAERLKQTRISLAAQTNGSDSHRWLQAQQVAFEEAHAYAVARPDRAPLVEALATPEDVGELAAEAARTGNRMLARIVNALLAGR